MGRVRSKPGSLSASIADDVAGEDRLAVDGPSPPTVEGFAARSYVFFGGTDGLQEGDGVFAERASFAVVFLPDVVGLAGVFVLLV